MQLTADSAVSSPSADAANNGKDVMSQPQQEPAMQRSDQQLAPGSTAGKRPAQPDARVDTTPADSKELMAACGGDVADAEQQQAKRRKLEAQAPALQEAPAAAAGAADSDDLALPDLSIIDELAAEIDALPRVQASDSLRPAAAGDRPADQPVSRGGSSDSPVLPSMQEQPPASSRSLTFQEGAAAADGTAARLLVASMPHAAPLSAYARLKAKADLEASRAAAEARKAAAAAEAAVAAAEAAVAARKAAALSKRQWHSSGLDSTLQHQAPGQLSDDEDEQMRGVPGYVPKWLREWRPKARAAAAAARANKQRHKAVSAAAAAAAAHPNKQGRRRPGPGMQDGWREQLQDAHGNGQHHKHLGFLLGALMEDGSPAKSQPAAAAALAAAGDGHAQGRFVFQADMLPPLPSTSQRSSSDDSDPDSPDALPRDAGRNLAMLLTSSAEPELPKAQHKERAASRSGDGGAIFTLPNQEWRKLSATAGLHALAQKQLQRQGQLDAAQQKLLQQQERAAQIKVGCSNAHLARAVQDYRGVFAVEGTDLYEVRMYRSKLGKVLRLKDHSDAADAARAFDRAALCLARAGMGSRNPELNFPAKDYEGESLPDLRGKGPAEMRAILAEAFSGHTPPGVTKNRQSLSGMPVAWPASSDDRDSPPDLPPPQPQQLQQWLPSSFQDAAEERSPSADKSGAGLVWGGRKQRSPMSPSKQPVESRQLQAQQGAKAGCAALMAAGLKGGAGSTAAALPGARLHPAAAATAATAAAAAATGTAPVAHTGLAVARQQALQAAPGAVPPPPQQQQLGGAEGAMLGKMLGDLQAMSRHCSGVQACLRQFRRELTQDPAATEAAAVAGPTAKEEVRATLASVEACQQQESALQTLLADTMQLLQPALSDEERRQLQSNSVQLAPALDALSGALSEVCCAVLRAAVTQDAAACAAAAVAVGAGDNPAAAAAAGALAAVSQSGLGALQQVVAPALDQIPAGSARAKRMARLSRAIRASQDSIMAAKKVLSGQE